MSSSVFLSLPASSCAFCVVVVVVVVLRLPARPMRPASSCASCVFLCVLFFLFGACAKALKCGQFRPKSRLKALEFDKVRSHF